MIGIIGAMDVEVNALQEMMSGSKSETISGIKFVSGKIHNKDTVIAACGVGKVFAAIAAEAMILKFNTDIVVNSGVAGSLSHMLGITDIAIAKDVVQHDMNTTPLGDPPGLLSGINMVKIPCAARAADILKKSVESLEIPYAEGTIASGDLFVNSIEQKKKIAEKFNAVACEMEGASIGQVCYVNGVDFAVIRSISDTLNDNSNMEYSEFVKIAAKNSIAVMNKFLKNY